MKKLFLAILLLASPVFAAQKYNFKDPKMNDELGNNYKEHSFPNWVNARGSSATITYLNVSTITLNGVNVGSGIGLLASTQTWTGANTYAGSLTASSATFTGNPTITKADDARLTLTDTGESSVFYLRSDGPNTQIGTSSNGPWTLLANSARIASIGVSSFSAKGTTTSDNAATGDYGEYISTRTALVEIGADGTFYDLLITTVAAGDWDISAAADFNRNASATWSGGSLGVGPIAGNTASGLTTGDNRLSLSFASTTSAITGFNITIPTFRVSLATSTPYHFKVRVDYSAGTPKVAGRISVRRVR